MLCGRAVNTVGNINTPGQCSGDSGGPLITNEGKFYSIIGKNIDKPQAKFQSQSNP